MLSCQGSIFTNVDRQKKTQEPVLLVGGPRLLVLYIFHFGDFICTKMSRSQNHHAQDNFSLNAKFLPILMQIASADDHLNHETNIIHV